MAPSLDSLAWFYRGKVEQAAGMSESLDHKIIYSLLTVFTTIGIFATISTLFQLTRLVFSLFILPGKPVCSEYPSTAYNLLMLTSASFVHSVNLPKHGH